MELLTLFSPMAKNLSNLSGWFNQRRSKRIYQANNDLIQMVIFYVINKTSLNVQIVHDGKNGLKNIYNLHLYEIDSLYQSLEKSHAMLLTSTQYTLEDKLKFYKNLSDFQQKIADIDFNELPPSTKDKLKNFGITFGMYCFFVLIALVASKIQYNYPSFTNLNELGTFIWCLFFFGIVFVWAIIVILWIINDLF